MKAKTQKATKREKLPPLAALPPGDLAITEAEAEVLRAVLLPKLQALAEYEAAIQKRGGNARLYEFRTATLDPASLSRPVKNLPDIIRDAFGGAGASQQFEESKEQDYTGRRGGTLSDAYEIEEELIIARVRNMPRDRLPALAKLIDDFERTNGEVAASQPATATPRSDWIEARDNRQKGRKVADVLAEFIEAKFADELGKTMTRAKLRRFASLYQDYYNHLPQLPPELQRIPTKPELNTRRLAALAEIGELPPPPRSLRSDETRLYEVALKRSHKAAASVG